MSSLFRRALATGIREAIPRAGRPLPPTIYHTKKIWPPDFDLLSAEEQLRFEKKFKRRVTLATRRPRWDKVVKLAQLFGTGGFLLWVFVYAGDEWWSRTPRDKPKMEDMSNSK